MKLSGKKILVTGGAGFIGANLVSELLSENCRVVVIDNLSTGREENLNPAAVFFNVDICDKKINEIFEKEKPDIVFHLAAQVNVRESVKDPIKDAKINILGSLNVLENCKKIGVKKIIFASTGGAIYGEASIIPTPENYPEFPLSPYGAAKLSVERYLNYYHKNFYLNFVILRLANVYGPMQNPFGEAGVISIFCNKALRGENPVIFGDGKQTRDFVYVKDVVSAFISAAESDKTGIFNVGTGKESDINYVFSKIKELAGLSYSPSYAPAQQGEQKRSCLDYSKINKEFAWTPKYSLEDGLQETLKWFELR